MRKTNEQINYGNRRERMDPNLERKLGDPESLYAKSPALKKGAADVERLISNRFGKVADKLKEVTGIQDLSASNVMNMLVNEMMMKTREVLNLESTIKPQLKQIAIDACLDETEADPSWFIIECRLNEAPIDVSNFRYQPEEPKDDEDEEGDEGDEENANFEIPSFDVEDLTPEEEFELEKHKRNMINALIQGASKKGHYVFQKPNVKAQLDALNPRLYPNYLAIMAINDFLYFSMEQMIEMMSETGQGVAGKMELEEPDSDDIDNFEEDNPGEEVPDTKIVATGLFFAILCHEIIKGIEESAGRHGLPKEPTMRQNVVGQTDILSNEPMQLRIGPEIHEMMRFALPDEMFEPQNKGLIYWFKVVLYQIEAKEFLSIMGDVISEDEQKNKRATAKFKEIMREAQQLKKEYDDYKESKNEEPDDNPEDDDGLDDFLSSLGISTPD